MKVLCRQDLSNAINTSESNVFNIQDGRHSNAKIISYNPVIGQATSLLRGVLNLDEPMLFKPGESIAVRTKEIFIIPADHFGVCFNRVLNTHEQLSVDTTFIDPGYEGHLHFVIHNCGLSEISITSPKEHPIAKVVFFKCEDIGAGKLAQGRDDIIRSLDKVNQREIERIKKAKYAKAKARNILFGSFSSCLIALIMIHIYIKSINQNIGDILTSTATLFAAFTPIFVIHFWNNNSDKD